MTALRLPREIHASHTMIMGNPRTGKTALMRQFACQIREAGERAVVYDPHGELIQEFWQDGDTLLNPLDRRGAGWTPGDELPLTLTPGQVSAWTLAIAKSLFPVRPYDQAFFAENTQRVCAELLTHRPTGPQLADWMSDPGELARLVRGTSSEASLSHSAPQQREGIVAELNRVGDALRLLPDLWDTPERWSAAEWAQTGKGWIFLTSTPLDRDRLRPLTSLWIDLLILQLMTVKKPKWQRDWFLLAEVATLQRLTHFYTALTEARKYNNPIVFDVQGRSQIKALYGELAEVLLSASAVQIFLGTSERTAAEWIADTIGKIEVQRVEESRSEGGPRHSGKRLTRHLEHLVIPSQIMGLPKMHGYLTMENFVVPIEFPYLDLPKHTSAFLERPAAARRSTPTTVLDLDEATTPTRYR